MARPPFRLDVYVITDATLVPGRDHLAIARAAVAGGATAIQLREKGASGRELLAWARAMEAIAREGGATFFVNDRADVAALAGASGLHVGQEDLPAREVRRLVGDGVIVGVSAGTPEEARRAEADGADYIGVGPVFATATKSDAGAAIGPEGLARVAAATRLPVVAIGGITAENAPLAIEAGADGVAVIAAVVRAPDMVAATRQLAASVAAARARRNRTR